MVTVVGTRASSFTPADVGMLIGIAVIVVLLAWGVLAGVRRQRQPNS
jgi:hypothetical protein